MRRGLHILGASGDALKSQYIVLRVEHIDVPTLKAKLGSSGGLASLALDVADWKPRAFVDVALPVAARQLRELGIEAELYASDAAPASRKKSEFWGGLAVGGVLGLGFWAIWKGLVGLVGG